MRCYFFSYNNKAIELEKYLRLLQFDDARLKSQVNYYCLQMGYWNQ